MDTWDGDVWPRDARTATARLFVQESLEEIVLGCGTEGENREPLRAGETMGEGESHHSIASLSRAHNSLHRCSPESRA